MMKENAQEHLNASLSEVDPEVAKYINEEETRQENGLEMIASENYVPKAILQAQGSILTNKYAEGYPGKRYYGGCEVVDKIEALAIDRAKKVFSAEHANVQPHSGSSANQAVFQAFLKPGDKVLGLEISHGGHLTHGTKINFSGRFYDVVTYGVDKETSLINMDSVREIALKERPKMIIAGWSAYPRHLDFKAFREIADEVGAYLFVDMAHFAGMVAAGLHPNPVEYADVVSSTMHKTMCGPRSGIILSKEEHTKKINSAVFPGQQGGPLMHIVAAKATALKIAQTQYFKDVQQKTLDSAKVIAERLTQKDVVDAGVRLLTGGTDVHLVLVDLRNTNTNGQEIENILSQAGITVNKNGVPFDDKPPTITSGVRIGTPALVNRGLELTDFEEIADILANVLVDQKNANTEQLRARVKKITSKYPIYNSVSL